MIPLDINEWPGDVPLPSGTVSVPPLKPRCFIRIEADRTREEISGTFLLPLSLADASHWYRTRMNTLEWDIIEEKGGESDRGMVFESFAFASFLFSRKSDPALRARISLDRHKETAMTHAMLIRWARVPWVPPSEGEAEGSSTLADSDDEQRID
jgi:hypothetical protein